MMSRSLATTAAIDPTPLSDVLGRVGDRWSLPVLLSLAEAGGPVRFTAIRRRMPAVSARMLAHTLRALERDGYVTRTVYPAVPPKVEYAISSLGRSFLGPLQILMAWAHDNQARILEARAVYQPRERHAAL